MTGTRFNSAVWLALLVSLGLFFRIPLGGGHELNVSLYDFVVPVVLVWACFRREILWPRLRDTFWPTVVVAAIFGHSLILADPSDQLGNIRESVKLAVICFEVWTLCLLFRAPSIDLPPIWTICVGFCTSIAFAVLEVYREGFVGGSYDALQTVHASVASGIGVVLCISVYAGVRARLGFLVSFSLLLLFALFIMVAKIYLVISAAIACILVLAPNLRVATREVVGLGILISMLLVFGCIILGSIYFRDYLPFSYMQDVSTSFGYRLELWLAAWSAFLEKFPHGLGAGQFGAYMMQVSSPFLFVHNTFLGILVEFGILGIVFVAGLVYLIARSVSGWPFPIGLIALLFLVVPMIFHDVLGIRANHVLLALGLTAAGRWRLKLKQHTGMTE